MTNDPTTVRRRWTRGLWGLLAIAGVGTAVYSALPYLSLDPDASRLPLNPGIGAHFTSLIVHGLPGALALFLGPFQFVTRLRTRWPRAHRVAGRVYMVSVVVAAVAAMFAATFSVSGLPAQVAFYILGAAWLYTLAMAYRAIRRRDVPLHRMWMIRNYSLTFAAATLRVYLVGGLLLLEPFPSVTFDDVYVIAVWGSILVNVLVAEYLLVHRTPPTTTDRPVGPTAGQLR